MEPPSVITYVVGAVLVVGVVAGAWYFRSQGAKAPAGEPTTGGNPMTAVSPTPGPITKLGCDQQYYNPKIGFAEYYLSAAGGDLVSAKSVSCAFTALVDGKVVASATAQGPLSDAPQRGGGTFVCTTKAVKLDPNVPTVVDVVLTDDLDVTSTCSATFTFPQP